MPEANVETMGLCRSTVMELHAKQIELSIICDRGLYVWVQTNRSVIHLCRKMTLIPLKLYYISLDGVV